MGSLNLPNEDMQKVKDVVVAHEANLFATSDLTVRTEYDECATYTRIIEEIDLVLEGHPRYGSE